MADQQALDQCYMQTALLHSKLSKAQRAKVGACLVTKQGVCLTGFNGTYSGADNCCEDVVDGALVSKLEVLHAENNCLLKAAREGVSVLGSTVYITLSPCVACSAMLIQAGVERVVYLEDYRCSKGLQLLKEAGIIVHQLNL